MSSCALRARSPTDTCVCDSVRQTRQKRQTRQTRQTRRSAWERAHALLRPRRPSQPTTTPGTAEQGRWLFGLQRRAPFATFSARWRGGAQGDEPSASRDPRVR
jgi:hypothetical protein